MKISNFQFPIFNKRGFTLIETLIAIFIFTLAMGAATSFVVLFYRTHSYASEQSAAIEEARRGIEMMVKEVRAAATGENGAFPVERADDKQLIFYSDIDKDGQTERVRYFLSTVASGSQIKECTVTTQGGACNVSFTNFLTGTLTSALVSVSVMGDLDASNEYVEILADGTSLASRFCQYGCLHCSGSYEGATTFDVTSQASDNSIQFTADGSSYVHRQCPVASPNYSMKARFELSWTEEVIGLGTELKKGVIEPYIENPGDSVEYPSDQENISIITSYVRNNPPIFKYYDSNGDEIVSVPARLADTKLMKVYLVVNINLNRPPNDFELESFVQLRNLKTE